MIITATRSPFGRTVPSPCLRRITSSGRHGFLRRRLGHAEAVGFIDNVEQSGRLAVVSVDDATERLAWDWLRRHDERPYTFVDATRLRSDAA
jgi:predicted nucleic acid-binding protein